MAAELHIADDFGTILDITEAVTFKRRGCSTTIEVPKAWRYASFAEQAESGVSGVSRTDVVWQFSWPTEIDPPRIGDSIIDAASGCWTILSIDERGAKTRLRCVTRNLEIVHQLVDRVEIQAALWEESGSGPEIVGWTTLRSAVPARLQPVRTKIDDTADPPTSNSTYHVLLADDTPLDHNHRLVGPEGTIYRLVEYAQAERIDTLPLVIVTRVAAS